MSATWGGPGFYQEQRHRVLASMAIDLVIVTASLDRLLHHSTVINIRGNSCWLKGKKGAEVWEADQNIEKSGSVFTTENGSLLKDH